MSNGVLFMENCEICIKLSALVVMFLTDSRGSLL